MLKIFFKIILLIFAAASFLSAQNNYIQVKGDSLVGKTINGEMIREVFGNVVLTQNNVVITCNQATQFISKNQAELIGNVVIKQDSITITTARGFYFGDEKKSVSDTDVKLEDGKVVLTAKRGEYFFDEHRAFFQDSVVLKDSVSTLTADSLTYFKDENRIVAVSNVNIADSASIITADSLEHFRKTRITFADHNVKVVNKTNNLILFGEHLEDYPEKHYTLVNKKPVLLQIDTSYVHSADSLAYSNSQQADSTMKIDTLVIRSRIMEAYRDTLNYFKATDSVKIVRGNFASLNDFTIYFKKAEKIITYKTSDSTLPTGQAGLPDGEAGAQPYLWYENSQLTGDSVTISLDNNKIRFLKVNKNAFIISQNEYNPVRFDQTSGDSVLMTFENSKLIQTDVWGNVFSIYYQYDGKEPNGLTKSSSQNAVILFGNPSLRDKNSKVDEIRLYGSPNSEYYPEKLVKGKEEGFVLARYVAFKQKPAKEILLEGIKSK